MSLVLVSAVMLVLLVPAVVRLLWVIVITALLLMTIEILSVGVQGIRGPHAGTDRTTNTRSNAATTLLTGPGRSVGGICRSLGMAVLWLEHRVLHETLWKANAHSANTHSMTADPYMTTNTSNTNTHTIS